MRGGDLFLSPWIQKTPESGAPDGNGGLKCGREMEKGMVGGEWEGKGQVSLPLYPQKKPST